MKDAFSERCWYILQRYWVIPMPESYRPGAYTRELDGFCVVCGDWVPKTDPEGSACPNRYLTPHSEILPYVVEAMKAISKGEWLTVGDLKKAAKEGRARWRENCQSGVQR